MSCKTFLTLLSLIVLVQNVVSQQTCNGSLATPLVNITFGAGSNPGPPLKAATTSYQYQAADCPQDGFYAVRNSSDACFYGDWQPVPRDHTGDPGGYFMLVNTSYGAGDFYVDTIRDLCSNTNYEFAAWILNVDRSSSCPGQLRLPNVTFTVENLNGKVLASYNTGDIQPDSAIWKRYNFYFSSDAPSLVLRIANNTPGGCGDDLALDDITFSACNPTVISEIHDGASPVDAHICFGKDTSIRFTSRITSGYTNLQYQWQSSVDGANWENIPGANDSTFTKIFAKGAAPGPYLNRLIVAKAPNIDVPGCRLISDSNIVNIEPLPIPAATSNSPVCEGSGLNLSSSGGSAYSWTGPAGYSAEGAVQSIANLTASNAGRYTVQVRSDYGCVSNGSVDVVVNPSPKATAGPSVSICETTSTQLTSSGGSRYKWFPSTGLSNDTIANPTALVSDTTQYFVSVSNEYNCADTASTIVNIWKKPVADAGPPLQMTQGQTLTLKGSVAGYDITYFWSPAAYMNDPKSLQPVITPPESITYTLHAVSNAGCGSAVSTVYITVYKRVDVPNAFSPNGDGINDTWNIIALQTYPTADLSVFTRGGQLVFHSIGYNKQWDGTFNGKPLAVGTYYYMINLKNGSPLKSGSVTIIK